MPLPASSSVQVTAEEADADPAEGTSKPAADGDLGVDFATDDDLVDGMHAFTAHDAKRSRRNAAPSPSRKSVRAQ